MNLFNRISRKNKKVMSKDDNLDHIQFEKDPLDKDFDDLKRFSFGGNVYRCKIVSVYDGDTCDVVILYNNIPIRIIIRMIGYDTPEKRPSKELPYRDLEKEASNLVTEYFKKNYLNKKCWVKIYDGAKFAPRNLGEIFEDEGLTRSINNKMIMLGFGKNYEGDAKDKGDNEHSNFTIKELEKIISDLS